MSLYEKCAPCDGSEITAEQLLLSLFRIDSEGNVGMEVKLNICEENSTPFVPCDGSTRTLDQAIKASIVMDDCNHCSLKLFVDMAAVLSYICDYCDQR